MKDYDRIDAEYEPYYDECDEFDCDDDTETDEEITEVPTIGDETFPINLNGFQSWLEKSKSKQGGRRSEESIKRYIGSMELFIRLNDDDEIFSKKNIAVAVENAKEEFAAQTVNGLISVINLYCLYVDRKEWQTSQVKVQRKQFLDDVISMADYEFLLKKAKACKKWTVYLYARIAGTTGMRLCEMLQVKREHIEHGCVDLYGKGAKQRRIYFPVIMRTEVLEILDGIGIKSGFVFRSRGSDRALKKRRIQALLTLFEKQCEFPKGLLHAHGFRHFFAKEFIRKYQNIALLADLLGHSNIETTRIYLKYTSKEQGDIVNEVVTW